MPVFLTRKDVANLLRLSPRQVDRLAADGVLQKQKLSASRSGFDRTGVEQHLAKMRGQTANPSVPQASAPHAIVEGVLAGGIGPDGRGVSGQVYGSPTVMVVVGLEESNADAAAALDAHLAKQGFKGCLVMLGGKQITVMFAESLGYDADAIRRVVQSVKVTAVHV